MVVDAISYYGDFGSDILVQNGATVRFRNAYIGDKEDSQQTAIVKGEASSWINTSNVIVGFLGTGKLEVSGGAYLESNWGTIGHAQAASGVAVISGDSTLWVNKGGLLIGNDGDAHLSVESGAKVTADEDIYVSRNGGVATVDLHFNQNGVLRAGVDGSGDFTNNGVVNLFAYASLSAGSALRPIEVGDGGSYLGNGVYNAFGGTYDPSTGEFVVGALANGAEGLVAQDLSGQRYEFDSGELMVAFHQEAGIADFNAVAITPNAIGENPVVGAYSFSTSLSETNVLLAFQVGTGLDAETFSIWHLAEGETEWTLFDPETFSYADGWASFTVSGFSDYAITAVPEPSAYALIFGICGLALVIRRRQ